MSNTGGIVVIGAGATIGLAVLAHFLAKTGATASKLDILLDEFSFSSKGVGGLGITIPHITFHAKLRINNPTNDSLTITRPYLKVFYKDNTSPIGVSPVSETTYELKAKKSTPIDVFVEFPSLKVLPQMPDMLKYLLRRIVGAPSTRKLIVEMQVSGNGINQTQKQDVAI